MKHNEIRDKVMAGSKLAVQRLLDRKKKDNGFVVVSQNGKAVKIAAKDVKS